MRMSAVGCRNLHYNAYLIFFGTLITLPALEFYYSCGLKANSEDCDCKQVRLKSSFVKTRANLLSRRLSERGTELN